MPKTDTQQKLNEAIKIGKDYVYFLSRKPNLSYCTENERERWEEAIKEAYTAFIKMYNAYKHELKLHYTNSELAFFPPENHKHFFPEDHINTFAKRPLEQHFLYTRLLGDILNRYHKINCKAPFPKVRHVLNCLKELRDKVEWESETPVPPKEEYTTKEVCKMLGIASSTFCGYKSKIDGFPEPIDPEKMPHIYSKEAVSQIRSLVGTHRNSLTKKIPTKTKQTKKITKKHLRT